MKTLYDYYDANPYKNREVKNKDVEGFLITPDDFLKYLEEIKMPTKVSILLKEFEEREEYKRFVRSAYESDFLNTETIRVAK